MQVQPNKNNIDIDNKEATQRVRFSEVSVGEFFKECLTGAWLKKVTDMSGKYQSDCGSFEPSFATSELVFV